MPRPPKRLRPIQPRRHSVQHRRDRTHRAGTLASPTRERALIATDKQSNWFGSGSFWSGDKLPLVSAISSAAKSPSPRPDRRQGDYPAHDRPTIHSDGHKPPDPVSTKWGREPNILGRVANCQFDMALLLMPNGRTVPSASSDVLGQCVRCVARLVVDTAKHVDGHPRGDPRAAQPRRFPACPAKSGRRSRLIKALRLYATHR